MYNQTDTSLNRSCYASRTDLAAKRHCCSCTSTGNSPQTAGSTERSCTVPSSRCQKQELCTQHQLLTVRLRILSSSLLVACCAAFSLAFSAFRPCAACTVLSSSAGSVIPSEEHTHCQQQQQQLCTCQGGPECQEFRDSGQSYIQLSYQDTCASSCCDCRHTNALGIHSAGCHLCDLWLAPQLGVKRRSAPDRPDSG